MSWDWRGCESYDKHWVDEVEKRVGVLCGHEMSIKLKEKFTIIRPTMLYNTECWAIKKQGKIWLVWNVNGLVEIQRKIWFKNLLRDIVVPYWWKDEGVTCYGLVMCYVEQLMHQWENVSLLKLRIGNKKR